MIRDTTHSLHIAHKNILSDYASHIMHMIQNVMHLIPIITLYFTIYHTHTTLEHTLNIPLINSTHDLRYTL